MSAPAHQSSRATSGWPHQGCAHLQRHVVVGASSSEQSGHLWVPASRLYAPALPRRCRRQPIRAVGPPLGACITTVCTCTALSLSAPARQSSRATSGCPTSRLCAPAVPYRCRCSSSEQVGHPWAPASRLCAPALTFQCRRQLIRAVGPLWLPASRLCAPALPCRCRRQLMRAVGPPRGCPRQGRVHLDCLLCLASSSEQSGHLWVPASRLCEPPLPRCIGASSSEQPGHPGCPHQGCVHPHCLAHVGASSSEQSGHLQVPASRLCAPALPCCCRRQLMRAVGPPPGAPAATITTTTTTNNNDIKAECACTALLLSAPTHQSGRVTSGCPHQGCVHLQRLVVVGASSSEQSGHIRVPILLKHIIIIIIIVI